MVSRSIDYYELLHVHPEAPEAVIKASYRTLMQKLKMHPDLGGDASVASDINAAYHILSNPQRRAEYDQQRQSVDAKPEAKTQQKRKSFSFGMKAARSSAPPKARSNREKAREHSRTTGSSSETFRQDRSNRVMWSADSTAFTRECQFCKTSHPFGHNVPKTAVCKRCHSPLASAQDSTTLQDGKRALSRLDLERQISFSQLPSGATALATTTDLSLSGLKFRSNAELLIDQLIRISSPFCEALGRVAHVTPTSSGEHQYGIEFLTLYFPNTSGSLISTSA